MLNDPPPQHERRVHPLERRPEPQPPADGEQPARRMIKLHIPVVKPGATYTLIAINSAIYIIAFFVLSASDLNRLYDWGANTHDGVLNGEVYRLFTSMFLHVNQYHIIFNMMSLYFVGITVERFFGHVRFTLIYFLGGLAGSVASVILNNTASVGASGAVFAIFGAEIVFLYRHRKLLGPMGQAQLRQLVVIAVINFVVGFASSLSAQGVQIDNWAHIGGILGGAALAWYIGPIFLFKRHPNHPDELITVDLQPVERAVQPVLIYLSVLATVLVIAIFA